MAHWRQRFPSKYLQAADLDSPRDVIVKAVETELIGVGERAEKKPILVFKERDTKPVVLNLTRSEAVATIAGTDDDAEWIGTRVRLQRGSTRYQGKRVDCIDIVAPPAAASPRPKGKPSASLEPDDPMPDTDDESEEPF